MIYKLIIQHLISIKLIIFVVSNPIKVLEKGILPLETNSVAIQFFLDLENDHKLESCRLHSHANKCCLYDTREMDCDSMQLVGKYDDMLKPKDRKTYLFFYITMFQINRQGYCNFDFIYRCGKTSSKSDEVKIFFDTGLHKKQTQYLLHNFKREKKAKCKSIDEDPLNNCRPVNCDVKYAGTKHYFDKTTRKCIEAVECIADPLKSLPDIVYEPASNTCKDLDHSLSVSDIYAINSGLGVIVTPRSALTNNTEDINLIVYNPNCSTISQNALFLKDLVTGKLYTGKGYLVDFKESFNNAFMPIFTTIFGISAAMALLVCIVNAGFIVYKEWKTGSVKKKVNDMRHEVEKSCSEECPENNKVKNKLLKEVIVSQLPLELRDSVVDVCERVGKEVRWKRRYRMIDDGSDINLRPVPSSDTFTTSDLDVSEKARLLK